MLVDERELRWCAADPASVDAVFLRIRWMTNGNGRGFRDMLRRVRFNDRLVIRIVWEKMQSRPALVREAR